MRVGLFLSDFPIYYLPWACEIVDGLAARGLEIDLYLQNAGEKAPVLRNNINMINLSNPALRCSQEELDYVARQNIPFSHLLSPASIGLTQIISEKKKYDYCIGLESKGLLLAKIAADASRCRLGYLSFELYGASHPGVWGDEIHDVKKFESLLMPEIDLFMIQDETRHNEYFKILNTNQRPQNTMYFPVSLPRVFLSEKPRYWHRKYNLPQECKIIFYIGQICKNRLVDKMVMGAQSFDDDQLLVVHGPAFGNINDILRQLKQLDKKNKVIFSTDDVDYNEMKYLVSSADMGLVFYRADRINDFTTGKSSAKLARYMQAGIPVICPEYPTFKDVVDKYHNGEYFSDFARLPQLVNRIFDNYSYYCKGAKRAFEYIYNLDKYLNVLSKHIKNGNCSNISGTLSVDTTWQQVRQMTVIRLYAGDVPKQKEYEGVIGLSLSRNDQNHLQHDITQPFPLMDNSVDSFQAEDVIEHIPYEKLAPVINEIYRILKPGGLFRLSVPDYGCDLLQNRSIKDEKGQIVFDPGGGGTPENPGHVWFPRIDTIMQLLTKTKFHESGKIELLHYYNNDGTFMAKPIDYSKGHVRRTPDFDERVKNPYRPMSLVIDLIKGRAIASQNCRTKPEIWSHSVAANETNSSPIWCSERQNQYTQSRLTENSLALSANQQVSHSTPSCSAVGLFDAEPSEPGRIYILPVQQQFQPTSMPARYPKHNDFYGVEQDFLLFLQNHKELITHDWQEAKWHYLPVFWTHWLVSHDYGKRDLDKLQHEVNRSILDDSRTFTICQYADGPLVDIGLTSVFLSSRNTERGIDIPCLCAPHKKPSRLPVKKYLASFVGRLSTGEVRRQMAENLKGHSDILITDRSEGTDYFAQTMLESYIALSPRGYGGGSFRFYEAMQLGAVPFLIGNIDTRAFKDFINWDEVSFYAPDASDIAVRLRRMNKQQLLEMGAKAAKVWAEELSYQNWCRYVIKELRSHSDPITGFKVHKLKNLETIGTDYGKWTIPKGFLTRESICYCAGAGEDISFDVGIANQYGCNVHIFDPTPRAITHFNQLQNRTIKGEKTPINNNTTDFYDLTPNTLRKLRFSPTGIWDKETSIKFYAPKNPQHVSHSILNLQKTDSFFEAKVNRLSNIMRKLKHNRIDLLKLDIEGAEYKVIDSIIDDNLDIKVLCIEFDEAFNKLDEGYLTRIKNHLLKLKDFGFVIIDTDGHCNYTLIKKTVMQALERGAHKRGRDIGMSHFLSFIIPCYNCADTVGEAIESIYQQNLDIPFEVVCTDDGSEDSTREVLSYYQNKHSNLNVHYHDQNMGVYGGAAAANTCVANSKGDLIFRLDSDNILVPDSVSKLIKLLDKTGCDGAAVAELRYFEGSKGNYRHSHSCFYEAPNNICDISHILSTTMTPAASGNYLYTRKSFDRVGGYPNVGLDSLGFGFRQHATGGEIAILPGTFYWHRLSANSCWVHDEKRGVNGKYGATIFREFPELFTDETNSFLASPDCEKDFFKHLTSGRFKAVPKQSLAYLFQGYREQLDRKYSEAVNSFSKAISFGCKNWKVVWCLSQAAYNAGNMNLAKQAVGDVMKLAPGFAEAKDLLKQLEGISEQEVGSGIDQPENSCAKVTIKDVDILKGVRIYCDAPVYDEVGFDNCSSQTNGEYALIPYLIRPGDVVFDVGANKGEWSKHVLSTVSPVRLYSFEPVPDTFVMLKNTLSSLGASLHNTAISDRNGEKTFFYYHKNSELAKMSSFYRRPDFEKKLSIEPLPILVQAQTLDSFCKKHSISHIDFLKIDTEGGELDVLRGAVNLLLENRIKKLQFEYGGTYPDAGITLRQVCELLSSYGYAIFRILPDGLFYIGHWHNSLENNRYSNYLAVSSQQVGSYKVMENLPHPEAEQICDADVIEETGGKAEITPGIDTLSQVEAAGLWNKGEPLRLHLGCGEQHLEGYINIDYSPSEHNLIRVKADIYADIKSLDFPSELVDEVRLHHVFEHFNRGNALALLVRWHKWLKVDGKLHIETPDVLGSAKMLASNVSYKIKQGILRHMFGSHEADWAYHYDGWYEDKFRRILSSLGFEVTCHTSQWQREPYLANVEVFAIKRRNMSREQLLTVCDQLLLDSKVDDIPAERKMHEIWMKDVRAFLDNTRSAQTVSAQNIRVRQAMNNIGGLIFSKDRTMQLRATLESLFLHCKDCDKISLTVLYKVSNLLYRQQYDDLKNRFGNVTFIEEQDFKQQTLGVIGTFEYILFMVDDNLFVKDFCLADVVRSLRDNHDAVGFSLRLGRNTDYCYMLSSRQALPKFSQAGSGILKYYWPGQQYDFGYPLELSSSVYRVRDILELLVQLEFSNPNTLEGQMAANSQLYSKARSSLLCYECSVTFCNPVNKIQEVCPHNISGADDNYTAERLAETYHQGMVIDVSKYDGFVSNGVHQETKLYFRKDVDALKISVIIPCYNQARYLPEAVESIVNQTYTNWECIIVNDGSSDNTVEAANQLIAKYPDRDIRFIDKPHSGVSETRNMGIEAASSEWILPLDSDDMLERRFIQKAVDIIQQEEKVDIVFANMQEFGASNGEWIPAEYSRAQVMFEDTMPYASLYREELWRKVGGYDKLLSVIRQPEDWSFWISCSKYEPVVKRIPEKLFLYRVDHQSVYHKMIKPNREVSWALLATCHPDLYPPQTLVDAWQLIANCPDNIYEKILTAPEKCPEYGLAYFWRALVNKKQGNIDDAMKDCQTAVERAKENDWQSAFVLMRWQNSQRDLVSAAESLEKLLSIRPDFGWAKNMLPDAARKSRSTESQTGRQKILFYFDRIGNLNETSPAGTVIAILNFARALQSSNPDVEIHITGDLVHYPEQYESFRVIPLSPPEQREQFITDYDVVFFATHVRYFKGLTKPSGQIWVLWQHCWEANDLVSLSHISDFDIVICLSELHRASLRGRSIGDEKLITIPNLIDTSVYSPRHIRRNNHSIMFAGGLNSHKCIHVLMDAFQLVRQQVEDAELHIYGDGQMWRGGDDYGNYLKSIKSDGTYFHGYVDNKDMPQIYSKHSILCLPSKLESFGLVTVEAQACGCVPVVHNVGGVAASLADGQTGLLYSPNTPEKLAETIIKAIKIVDADPSARQKAINFLRNTFSINRAAEYISKLWGRITIAKKVNTIRTLLEGNEIEQADFECEKLLQKNPNHPDVQLVHALIMLQQGNEPKTDVAIGELLENFPNHLMALNDFGLMAMKAGDTEKAIRYLTKAYKFNPWDKYTITNCYTILTTSGKYRDAKMLLLNYLTNVGEDAQILQLFSEIDNLIANAGSGTKVVSQEVLNNRQDVYCGSNTSMPLVSIITPVYNGADYIEQTIESVLAQDYPNFELVIIDDGSTDNTKEVILRYNDGRIRYLYQENKGVSSARNLAIKKTKGQYIMPLDADDMMTPDFIVKHLAEFEKYPDADLVYCDVLLTDGNSNPIRIMNKPEYQDRRHLIRDLFRAGHPIIPFRFGIKRSVFDKIGFYDEDLLIGEDYDMMRRFVKAGLKAHHLSEPLHLRRMQADSLSTNYSAQKAKSHFEVIKRFINTFAYDELFPDVAWDEIAPQMRQLHAKCLAAGTYLTIGQNYVRTKAIECSRIAFDLACSELNDCVKMEPENQGLRQLLQKSKLIRAKYTEAPQQAVS